jgi:hypothetical protein
MSLDALLFHRALFSTTPEKAVAEVSITIFAVRLLHKGLDVNRMEQTENGLRMSG